LLMMLNTTRSSSPIWSLVRLVSLTIRRELRAVRNGKQLTHP
jgi:hypothetical protein